MKSAISAEIFENVQAKFTAALLLWSVEAGNSEKQLSSPFRYADKPACVIHLPISTAKLSDVVSCHEKRGLL